MYSNLSDLEEAGEADDQDALLSALVRHAHSLKGGARTVALDQIESVCARLEATVRAVNAAAQLDGATVHALRSVLSDVEELISKDTASPHFVTRALRILEAIDPRTDIEEGNGAARAAAAAVEPALRADADIAPLPEDVELAEAMAAAEAALRTQDESAETPAVAEAEIPPSPQDVELAEAMRALEASVAAEEKAAEAAAPAEAEIVASPEDVELAEAMTAAEASLAGEDLQTDSVIDLREIQSLSEQIELSESTATADAVPAAAEAPPAGAEREKEEADDPATDPSKVHILVVDDSATSRVFVKNVLEGAHYSVTAATDGAEALVVLAREHIDLVVSDVEMPSVDGLALTARVRGHPRLCNLPVILVSGLESEADRARGLDAGANDYIPRTELDELRLLETVARLL
jgi:CheY-like chemotaxis protein/HPt (histidine-containing phosphotransfer) domain-containing protein